MKSSEKRIVAETYGVGKHFVVKKSIVERARKVLKAVDGVSLRVYEGETLCLVGESGCGKSVTSLSLMQLLQRPQGQITSGSIRLNVGGGKAVDVAQAPQYVMEAMRGSTVSMIFQEPMTAMNPVMRIGAQIEEVILQHKKAPDAAAAKARALEMIDLVGIANAERVYKMYPFELSGGMRQRAMIAMSLACDPKLIIADEPTTALDVTTQAQILDLLHDLRDRLGTAIILITHNMGVVADLADRVAVMYRGELVEQGSVHDIFAHPQHPYTRHLLQAVPHLGQPRPASIDAVPAQPVTERPVVIIDHLDIDFPGRLGSGPVHAVKDVSLTLREHEILALVGESGSGKTTLGRCAVGLLKPTRGEITVLDTAVSQAKGKPLRDLRRRIGFVFQDPAASLNPRLSVGACVAEPLRVHGIGTAPERRQKVRELLEAVELPSDYAQRYPHELSGGQRQRVSLARALVLGPEYLVADEPTSALDVSVQARVLDVFVRLQHEMGFACLFVTHDLAVVDLLADRIAVMEHGVLVELGERDQVLRDPQQEYTKTLLAAVPVPDPVEQADKREARMSLRAA